MRLSETRVIGAILLALGATGLWQGKISLRYTATPLTGVPAYALATLCCAAGVFLLITG